MWTGRANSGNMYRALVRYPVAMAQVPTVTLTNVNSSSFGATPVLAKSVVSGFEDARSATGTSVGYIRSTWTAATGWY